MSACFIEPTAGKAKGVEATSSDELAGVGNPDPLLDRFAATTRRAADLNRLLVNMHRRQGHSLSALLFCYVRTFEAK
jgi:hypothetical protein